MMKESVKDNVLLSGLWPGTRSRLLGRLQHVWGAVSRCPLESPARVKPSVFDPEIDQRQGAYLAALNTCGRTEVIEGCYQSHPGRRPLAKDFFVGKMTPIEVILSEEKGSDVNLASHLLFDACQDLFDVAAVITNDSDLTTPIEMVARTLGKRVILVTPLKPASQKRPNRSLVNAASSQKPIRDGVLKSSLFPNQVPHPRLVIKKPSRW